MLTLLWLKGLLSRRSGRLLGAILGVAVTVALLTSLGAFIASSSSSMTRRAVASVPVDWQVQLSPGADPTLVVDALSKSTRYTALEQVGYADSSGFSANTGGTVQTTGPGKVLGIGEGYKTNFSAELRALIGSLNTNDGALVAQQTAANLHVTVGDTVTIGRLGLPPATVKVAGVVDLPFADSLFQAVGMPPGTAPQAPPDNVLILPAGVWHGLFDQQAAVRPDSVHTQLHVRLANTLPSNPGSAYAAVQSMARNLEARIAGSGVVGDNLSARLDGARQDALYAQVLFLFLGLPGAVLAILLTLAVAASGAERRRREQALLRVRGASTGQILRLESLEAVVSGLGGVALGLGFALVVSQLLSIEAGIFGREALPWTATSVLLGLLLAAFAVLYPAWVQARRSTVAAARATVGRERKPLWQVVYLDLILLAVSAIAMWQTASTGYQVVLAPEGVPQSSVAYETFIAPVFLWLGVGLLTMRLWGGILGRGRRAVTASLRPLSGRLSGVVAASLGRQRSLVVRGLVLVALAFSFATSTAVFNTTYNAQSRVDAELTNGADVTIIGSTTSPPSSKLAQLSALPGVAGITAMQHRFAYVGNDLQDLYGIDPAHIGEATNMSNAFFAGGDARSTLAALAAHRDGVLVSEETVKDFQLNPGDQINLRLQNASDNQYHVVTFHLVGVVREFPTAPKDSFLITNSSYIAEQTGIGAAEIVLMRTQGNPGDLAASVHPIIAQLPQAQVNDIGSTQRVISSSLTAVDLRGLTTLELAFAVLMLAGATGLVLALGLAERRRTFSILTALGAKSSQLGAFLWSEGLLILVGGAVMGVLLGFGVAQMLVKILTGVFDPPPEAMSVPWLYLVLLGVAGVTSTVAAVTGALLASRRAVVESLRDI
ncbi:MAG: ABC transporter permease [Chloroflexi bacterium]|nr:ABC transporter permease [Chloroflexota bacterium]